MALGGGGDVVRKAAVAGGEFAFAEEIFEFGGGAERQPASSAPAG